MAEAKDKKEKQWIAPYGHFCWYELNSSDVANSASFYGGVFGWEAKEITKKPMPYTQFFSKGQMIAGMIETKYTGGCDPFWIPYVHSKKLEASIKTIEKNGGKVHKEPTDLGHIGRFAVISDPEGAGFALWEMAGKATPTKEGDKSVKKPETPFCWHELHTADQEDALKFYLPSLSWATQTSVSGYTMLSLKSDSKDPKKCFGGVMKLEEGEAKPGWVLYIGVENTDNTLTKVLKHGGKIIKPAMDVPKVGRIAIIADSQGAKFAIIQPSPENMPDGAAADDEKATKGKAKKGKNAAAEKKTKASRKKAKGAKRKAESESESESSEGEEDGEKRASDSDMSSDADKPKKKPQKGRGRGKKAKTG